MAFNPNYKDNQISAPNHLDILINSILAGSVDANRKWTIGSVGSTQTHQIYGELQQTYSIANTPALFTLLHSDATQAGSRTILRLQNSPGAGNPTPVVSWYISGVQEFMAGIDPADGNAWKLSGSGALGVNDFIRASTAGQVSLGTPGGSQIHRINGILLVDSGGGNGQFQRPDNAGLAFSLGNGANVAFGDMIFRNAVGNTTSVIISPSSGGDIIALSLKASTVSGVVRQLFRNSDNTRDFDHIVDFTPGSETYYIASDARNMLQFERTGNMSYIGAGYPSAVFVNSGQVNFNASGPDSGVINQYAGTTGGTVRQYFKNSTATKYFEIDADFTNDYLLFQSDTTTAGALLRNGRLAWIAGSQAIPHYGFYSYPGVGAYTETPNQYSISTNALERLRILSDGSLAILTGIFMRPDLAGTAFTLGNGTNTSNGAFEFHNALSSTINGSVTDNGIWTLGATGGSQAHQINGTLTILNASGAMLNVKDGGVFGTNADPSISFSDGSAIGGRIGYTNAASNDFFVQNTRSGGLVRFPVDGLEQFSIAGATGVHLAEGSNRRMGNSSLSGGTVTISNTSVTATTRIFLTKQSSGTPVATGTVRISAVVPGTSFTITSDNAADTSDIAWVMFEPA